MSLLALRTSICLSMVLTVVAYTSARIPVARGAGLPASHCVALIEPRLPGQASSVTPGPCFDTFPDAVAFATKDRVRLPKEARVDAVVHAIREHQDMAIEAKLRAADPAASPLHSDLAGPTPNPDQAIIGTDWESLNKSGRSPSWYVNNLHACAGVTEQYAYWVDAMPTINGFNWNDKVSSAEGYAYCNNFIHYENYLGGLQANCGTYCSYIGNAMNDKTSTERFWRS